MKKTIFILGLFIAVIMLFSCNDSSMESVIPQTSTNLAVNETAESNSLTSLQTQSTTIEKHFEETEKPSSTVIESSYNSENAAPRILTLNCEDIIAIQKAYEEMDEDTFIEYINAYNISYDANGLESKAAAKKIVDELKETTILLLDGNKNISNMYFYVERNEVQQSTLIEEDKRIICTYYTPQKPDRYNITLENSEKSELIGETSINDIPVKLFKIQDNSSYFAELTVNETVIHCRFTNVQTVDELKSYFLRLDFIRIGDLIK